MARLIDRIERLMFGATAQARVDQITRAIDRGVETALDRAFAGLDADADNEAFAAEDDEARTNGGDAA